jgi:signal transduction histidine kinase
MTTTTILIALCALLTGAVFVLGAKLRSSRLALEAAAADIRDLGERAKNAALLEVEWRRRQELLERMDEGVLVLDEGLVPVMVNDSARRVLGLEGDAALPAEIRSEEVAEIARRALKEKSAEALVNRWPARTTLRVRAVALEAQGGVAVLLQDVTEELRTVQSRKQLVASASHELKSPVASMQALAEAIKSAVRDDPVTAERFAEKLTGEADRLGRIIADLLDLSRVEDPAYAPDRATDLAAVARTVASELASAAAMADKRFDRRIDEDVWVKGDPGQLTLLIRNLLDNASRYTPAGKRIELDVRREGQDAVVRVADEGIGIPLDAQAHVFERFYRVDRDRSRERGGTGLGLSIVKHVVVLHDGRVGLESELGRGSTFTVRLPAIAPERRSLRPLAS